MMSSNRTTNQKADILTRKHATVAATPAMNAPTVVIQKNVHAAVKTVIATETLKAIVAPKPIL